MDISLKSLGLALTALIVSTDVIGIMPLYVTLIRPLGKEEKQRVLNQSMMVAVSVATLFAILGNQIFSIFGLELYDFRIAGGIVLLLIALAELTGGSHSDGLPFKFASVSPSGATPGRLATGIVPLGVPLITGPAMITTVTIQVSNYGYVITLSALALNALITWFALSHAERITKLLGQEGSLALSKLICFLLAGISIAMIRVGIFDAFHAFNTYRNP